jgi:hypothetical protein
MSPLQGFECMWRTYPWARAHGYIVPPRLGLNRKNEVETQNGVWSHFQPAVSQTQGCKNAAPSTPNGMPDLDHPQIPVFCHRHSGCNRIG